jgi:3-dehydroquinate synthase
MLDCKIFNYIFIANERNKSLKQVENIYKFLNSNNLGKDSLIIAVGGGITGDISGFTASTYMRGIRYYQVPTTLLSMVDSSVGGKTGVNFLNNKNLIGTFFQPEAVYILPDFLKTLPKRELFSGAGEVFKYSFLSDKENYIFLKKNLSKLFYENKINYTEVIKSCLSIKANIVKQDEREITGLRKILNLGHTFAHAFEVESNYKLKHGEAVIGGIFCAIILSEIVGFLDKAKSHTIMNDFSFIKIHKYVRNMNSELVYQKMLGDKKNSAGKMNLVLIENIGSLVVDVILPKAQIIESIERMKKL